MCGGCEEIQLVKFEIKAQKTESSWEDACRWVGSSIFAWCGDFTLSEKEWEMLAKTIGSLYNLLYSNLCQISLPWQATYTFVYVVFKLRYFQLIGMFWSAHKMIIVTMEKLSLFWIHKTSTEIFSKDTKLANTSLVLKVLGYRSIRFLWCWSDSSQLKAHVLYWEKEEKDCRRETTYKPLLQTE